MDEPLIETEIQNVADAISSCDALAAFHMDASRRMLYVVYIITGILIASLVLAFFMPNGRGASGGHWLSDFVLYAGFAVYVVGVGIFMATYRVHIAEAARLHHYKVGFMRIRVAGSNSTPGYRTEVRRALTESAFASDQFVKKRGKVDSPVPGHPTSDLGTALLNKLLDSFELVQKRASGRSRKTPERDI